jgi:hypothetical protein
MNRLGRVKHGSEQDTKNKERDYSIVIKDPKRNNNNEALSIGDYPCRSAHINVIPSKLACPEKRTRDRGAYAAIQKYLAKIQNQNKQKETHKTRRTLTPLRIHRIIHIGLKVIRI